MFARVIGGRRLNGTVHVSGSKNACLPALIASLLVDDECVIRNVPNLFDVRVILEIIERLGAKVSYIGNNNVKIVASNVGSDVPFDLATKMRGSVCLIGSLIARNGHVSMPYPGGCHIGARPIDLHLNGMRALGCHVETKSNGGINITSNGLVGTTVNLCGKFGSTTTGTMNVVMAALRAKGDTVIDHAAIEPEVVDFCKCLVSMGANIDGIGSPTMTVHGPCDLHGFDHTVIGDRIEAGTFACAGLITGGNVEITGIDRGVLDTFISTVRSADGNIFQKNDGTVVVDGTLKHGINFTTGPHPAFPTDLQSQMCTVLTQANGKSSVVETVYPDRFLYVDELKKMGAEISRVDGGVMVHGASNLHGANLSATDLRASAALFLAGLCADDETTIDSLHHLERGYENFGQKLCSLGACVEIVQ